MYDENKELATDKLLELLRGEKVEQIDEKTISVPLSPEEEKAILSSSVSEKEDKKVEVKSRKGDFFKKYLSFLKSKIKKLIIGKVGYIGLDIGSNGIKYVILSHSGKKILLEDYGIYPYRYGETTEEKIKEEMTNTLKSVINKDRKRSYHIISSVFGQKVAIKSVTLPKVAKNELRDALIWNVKKDLPFPIENSLVDFKVLGEVSEKGIPKLNAIIALADQEIIRNHLDILKSADIIPYRAVIVPLAIYNTFYFYTQKVGLKDGVIIDIGASNTYIIFLGDGNLQFAREIGIGGEDITKALIGTTSTNEGVVKIDRDYAEKLKKDVDFREENVLASFETGLSNSQLSMMIKPVIERIVIQIQRTFDYYRSKFPSGEPEKVYLSGGTANLKNFPKFLSDNLGKEVIVLNPLEFVKIASNIENKDNLKVAAPFLVTAFGNAVDEKRGLNLLPPEIKIIPLIVLQKKIFKLALVFVMIILVGYSLIVSNGKSNFEKRLNEINLYSKNAYPILSDFDKLRKQKSTVENDKNNFMSQLSGITEEVNIVAIMKILSSVTPEYVTLNDINISSKSVVISGYINNPNYNSEMFVADFNLRLEETNFFSKVNPYKEISPEGGSEKIQFEINCVL
jgi:type IV pilus assembly protein PilM